MKAVTINISLNPELAEFARSDSKAHAFDSMSEYMRDLIRRRRQEQIEKDVALLEKAIEGAPLGDPSDEEMAEIYASIKARRKKRIEKDMALLEKAIEGAPSGDPSNEEMTEIVKTQHRLRAERKKHARRS